MKLLNVFFFLFAVAASILQGCRQEDFVEEITQEDWEKISVGMDDTDVISILGYPLETLWDDSEQEEWWDYRPKGEIFSCAEKVLVVSHFTLIFSSNKVTRTFVTYECPEQRRSRRR